MGEAKPSEHFKKRTIWFHWAHTAAFLTLLITGGILFLPEVSSIATSGITRIVHHIAAVIFVGSALIYLPLNPRATFDFVRDAFSWDKGESEKSKDLLHPSSNNGQKIWQVVLLTTGAIFAMTGMLMWFFREIIPAGIFQWALVLHSLAFVIVLIMFLVHLYRQIGFTQSAMFSPFSQPTALQLEVDENLCVNCGKCLSVCPVDIHVSEYWDSSKCLRCLACTKACPVRAISYIEIEFKGAVRAE